MKENATIYLYMALGALDNARQLANNGNIDLLLKEFEHIEERIQKAIEEIESKDYEYERIF